MRIRTRSETWLLAVLLLAPRIYGQPPKAAAAPPATVVRDFYNWYLQALTQNEDPLTQDLAGVKKFVAPSMLAEINRLSKRPEGLEFDPFLHAQDFGEDWKDNVAVAERSNTGVSASMLVTLGLKDKEPNKLKVDLRKESGVWKIVKVERLYN